jgi:hypothetical protein
VIVVVDAANVMGSRPDGWWRDRAGAAARLYADLERIAARPAEIVPAETASAGYLLVLEGAARRAPVPAAAVLPGGLVRADDVAPGSVRVLLAEGSGDDAIVGAVCDLSGDRVVVTADRELRRRCAACGASAFGPGWLLGRL